MTVTIWYNSRCGTCQKVRAVVEAKGHHPQIVEYLKDPPTVAELDAVCRKLGMEPGQIARQKEPDYATVAARCHSRQEWLEALHDHPVLIERPIVVAGDRAVIARPPEKLAELL